MKAFSWFVLGFVAGVAGYRYYRENGNRLPILEQLTGESTGGLMNRATARMDEVRGQTEEAVNREVGRVAREAVTSVAEEITEAEQAKQREDIRSE